jgi:hypothetical protein
MLPNKAMQPTRRSGARLMARDVGWVRVVSVGIVGRQPWSASPRETKDVGVRCATPACVRARCLLVFEGRRSRANGPD